MSSSLTQVGGRLVRVWPENQSIGPVADPRMHATWFADHVAVNPEAVALVLDAARSAPRLERNRGGRKVRDRHVWDSAAMKLLTCRALGLVCLTRGLDVAHVVDRWANIMEHEEYSAAHSHYDSDLSVVYSLDPGDTTSPTGGQLTIIDPRIPACCTNRPERPTRGIMPQMVAGAMLLFPAEFLHLVTPYEGHRPRITLAWNISPGPPPPGLPDPTQPCAGPIARTGQ